MRQVIVDELLERLADALLAKDLPRPGPMAEPEAIEAAAAQIAPLTFPPEVRRLWERVDPGSFVPEPHPPLIHPSGGIYLRRRNDETSGPGLFPRNLFPLGYESWGFVLVELPTGELWEWRYDGTSFVLRHRGIEDWLQAYIDTVVAGGFTRSEEHVFLDMDRFREFSAPRLAARGAHPQYPDGEVATAATKWPEDWLIASGVTPDARRLRGATHTIAELLEDDVHEGTVATIAATVHDLGGNVDGCGLRVADGTGEMRLYSPASAHGATSPSVCARFEFDIVMHCEPTRNDPPAEDLAVQEVFGAWRRDWVGPSRAVVTAVRFIEDVPPT